MRLLVDAHAMIWYVDQHNLLSPDAHAAITDPSNELLLSAATLWEIAIKMSLKKLTLSLPYKQWMMKAIADLRLVLLPITVDDADVQIQLPRHHGDPFDRMLIAQSLAEPIAVVSSDSRFDAYQVQRVW